MAIRERIRSYERRDDDKVRTDKAKNDFESVIYALRDWLYDDNNQAFVKSAENDELITKLGQEEEWLVDGEGDSANATEYQKRYFDLNSKLTQFKSRKSEYA